MRAWARWSLFCFALVLLTNPALLLALVRPAALKAVARVPGIVERKYSRQNNIQKASRSYWVSVRYLRKDGEQAAAACPISEGGYARIVPGDMAGVHPLFFGWGVLDEDYGQAGHAAAVLAGFWLVLTLSYPVWVWRGARRWR